MIKNSKSWYLTSVLGSLTIYPLAKISKGARKKKKKKESKGLAEGIFVSLPKPKSYTQLQHKE